MSFAEKKAQEAHANHVEDYDEDFDKVEIQDDYHTDELQKLDEEEFAKLNRADLDAQVRELDEMAEHEHNNKTLWEKCYLYQFPINVPQSKMVMMVGVFAAFAGMLSGLDQSVISGAKHSMQAYFRAKGTPLSKHEISLVDSLMPIGAVTGSLMMTPLNHFVGRRGALMASCLWYTLGAILCAAAQNVETLYAGRYFVGCGVGIEGGCVGMYISESVPANVRGNLVSLYHFMLAFGEVVGYIVGAIFFNVYENDATGEHGAWRFMLGSSLLFSTILLIGLFCLPESPRWLMAHSKPGEAWFVWKKLRRHDDTAAQIEFLELRSTANREREIAQHEKFYERYLELFLIPRNRRAFIYSFIMVFLCQMTGINGVLYNMSSLMASIGFDAKQSVMMSIASGSSLWLGTIPAILWMDTRGRRPFAQTLIGSMMGLVLVGIGSLYNPEIASEKSKALGLSLSGIYIYLAFFGIYACFTWIVPAESFPLRVRAQGVSVCSALNFLWAFTVTYNFQQMQAEMTYIGLMLGFFGGIGFLGIVYQWFFMPETKGRTLEELDDVFGMRTHQLVAQNCRRMKARISTWGMKSLDDLETVRLRQRNTEPKV